MATIREGLVSDKITLTTADTEYYLSVTNLPPPGKNGGYLVWIKSITVTGDGIKFNVGQQGVDLAADSNALWVADDDLFFRILPGNSDLLMMGSDNSDSFQYFVTPD